MGCENEYGAEGEPRDLASCWSTCWIHPPGQSLQVQQEEHILTGNNQGPAL